MAEPENSGVQRIECSSRGSSKIFYVVREVEHPRTLENPLPIDCPRAQHQQGDSLQNTDNQNIDFQPNEYLRLQRGSAAQFVFSPESRVPAKYTDAGSPVAQPNETETAMKETMESNV